MNTPFKWFMKMYIYEGTYDMIPNKNPYFFATTVLNQIGWGFRG